MSQVHATGSLERLGEVDEPIYDVIVSEQKQKPGDLYRSTVEYLGRKPWNVVRAYIKHFAPATGSLIADPYVGGGTTTGEALRTRRRVLGLDVQPLSELINRSILSPIGPLAVHKKRIELGKQLEPVFAALRRAPTPESAAILLTDYDIDFLERPLPVDIQRPDARTYRDAFDPRHLVGLAATKNAIVQEPDEEMRILLWLAFANMLRYASRGYAWKQGARSPQKWSGDHVIFKYQRLGGFKHFTFIPFEQIFSHCFDRLYKLKQITEIDFGSYTKLGETAWFFRDDARRLSHYVSTVLGGEELDYVITDPPYSDLVPYNDLLSYWNVWLPAGLVPDQVPLDRDMKGTSGQNFADRLTQSICDAASVLKVDGWLTLFYLDVSDFSLWHRIVEEAADARLEHVNSTWLPQQIVSRTQHQNPLSGIRGSVIANFRRVSSRVRFVPSRPPVRPIPTPLSYLQFELQRLIVQNLGATTSEILSHLTDEIYTRSALQYFAEQDTGSITNLLQTLGAIHLEAITPADTSAIAVWVLGPEVPLDPELDPYDQLRYKLFLELASKNSASTSDLAQWVFTKFAGELPSGDLAGALSTFAKPVQMGQRGRGGWTIDWEGRMRSAQLRLLLSRSTAHSLRDVVQQRQHAANTEYVHSKLHIPRSGFASLSKVAPDGAGGPAWRQISRALHSLVSTLRDEAGDLIDSVWAVRGTVSGDWDSEDPTFDNLPLLIILRQDVENPVALEERMIEEVFGALYDRTRLNFVPFFRMVDDPDIGTLFGGTNERVCLLSSTSERNPADFEQSAVS
jgi:hypothetical protein